MKGKVGTAKLLKAVLHEEWGPEQNLLSSLSLRLVLT